MIIKWEKGKLAITHNVLRAGDRNPVLRLRQGYGACTLLQAVFSLEFCYCFDFACAK